ncbi:uncharacterized protein EDB93DRAFT_181449 [Suillus bovinus]|uniref:uncharacterized protein n=1 Tax=Suillus bovinus TaxID=48563 RepID=UPI001B86B951|nr:uncharacterized protein EDB93DRAFT_181449 [Suillus bovinus]KAG2127926.1 hypothetical protein EDB93DRAFT_181449 [Suillus bovinus]
MSKTTFSICTLTSACDTKLAQKTDVVVTLVPSPGDEDSVRSKPISWKVLTFHAESAANHSLTINPEIAVCTVKEEENGILTPQLSKTLMAARLYSSLRRREARYIGSQPLMRFPMTVSQSRMSVRIPGLLYAYSKRTTSNVSLSLIWAHSHRANNSRLMDRYIYKPTLW